MKAALWRECHCSSDDTSECELADPILPLGFNKNAFDSLWSYSLVKSPVR